MKRIHVSSCLASTIVSLLAACANSAGDEPRSAGGTLGHGGASRSGGASGSGGTAGSGGTTTERAQSAGGALAMGGAAAAGGRSGSGGSGTGGRDGAGGSYAADGGGGASTSLGIGGHTGDAASAGGSAGSGGSTGAGGSAHAGRWQIMPLGDSITGTTCYPKLLSQKLIDHGHTNFTFVGTVLNNQSCGSAPNVQTEGHGGYLVTYLTTDRPPQSGKGNLSELKSWAAEKPEVVLMQLGTNDCWSSVATDSILGAFSTVVDEFRKQKPDVIFFVAQITPLNPGGCANCEANVESLNAAIPGWASGKSTAGSPIHVVDIWSSVGPASGYTANSAYTGDGCHPNPAGSQKIADKWYEALIANGIS